MKPGQLWDYGRRGRGEEPRVKGEEGGGGGERTGQLRAMQQMQKQLAAVVLQLLMLQLQAGG